MRAEDLARLREQAMSVIPLPVEDAQIAHETYCLRIGGPVELHDGTCPECGWYWRPAMHVEIRVPAVDVLALLDRIAALESAAKRLRAEEREAFAVRLRHEAHEWALGRLPEQERRAVAGALESIADDIADGDPLDRVREAAIAEERRAVVAWLRQHPHEEPRRDDLADSIERGEHREGGADAE